MADDFFPPSEKPRDPARPLPSDPITKPPAAKKSQRPCIVASSFYAQFHGHPLDDLRALLSATDGPRMLLVGDSTLDNKYWVPPHAERHPHRELAALFDATLVRRDMAYWLTRSFGADRAAINCAVEESSLRLRGNRLLEHDELVRDALRQDDVLVVSIGGNDVAIVPTLCVAFAVLWQTYIGGWLGRGTLRRLFRDKVTAYIERLTSRCKPKLVVVCGLYFPDEAPKPSWASFTLRALGYNSKPQRLQGAIRRVYEDAVSAVQVDGCHVVHVPMHEALDGKVSSNYVARVEPSERGGRKLAEQLRVAVERGLAEAEQASYDQQGAGESVL